MNSAALETDANAAGSAARRARILRTVGFLLPLVLLLVSFYGWTTFAGEIGGFDAVVRRADFVSNLTGATIIREAHGESLYDLQTQHDAQARVFSPYVQLGPNDLLPYNHLPFEALVIAPLIGLPYTVLFTLWSLLMLAALGASLFIMRRALPVAGVAGAMLVVAAISYQPVIRSFMLGQNSPLVLLGLCGTYAALKRNREGLAGVALVLVALKPQLLPLVLLLLIMQKRWKTLGVFAGVLAALCVAVMPVLGLDWPMSYTRLLFGVANWHDTGAIDIRIMPTWRGLATHLFSWAPVLITPVFLVLLHFSIILLPWSVRRIRRAAPATGIDDPRRAALWAITGIGAVLTSIHLNPHDLTLLLFPGYIIAAIALSGAWEKSALPRWLALLWVGYGIANVGNTTTFVILNVLLMGVASLLLARQIAGASPAAVKVLPVPA